MRDIVTHLLTEYGQVEKQDLVGNRVKLSEPWYANRPFQELVQRVEEIQEFADDGGRTIADEDIVDKIYTLVLSVTPSIVNIIAAYRISLRFFLSSHLPAC